MRHTLRTLLLCIITAAIAFASCSKDDGESQRTIARQTLIVFMPWTGADGYSQSLYSFFRTNISDIKKSLEESKPEGSRVVVCLAEDAGSARLFEITGGSEKTILKYTSPDLSSVGGIRTVIQDCMRHTPAESYSMIVAGHGLGWISKSVYNSSSSANARLISQPRQGVPLTRFFGHALDQSRQTDISTLAEAIEGSGAKMRFILFDGCYMANVETAFMLRRATDYIVASPTEIMAYGMPYRMMLPQLLKGDYKAACDAMIDFYNTYSAMVNGQMRPYHYATISVTKTSEMEALATCMKNINKTYRADQINDIQRLDGYKPTLFYDFGSYVEHLYSTDNASKFKDIDAATYSAFMSQLSLAVPYKATTGEYFTDISAPHVVELKTYSGISTSDPSTHPYAADKEETEWWKMTH